MADARQQEAWAVLCTADAEEAWRKPGRRERRRESEAKPANSQKKKPGNFWSDWNFKSGGGWPRRLRPALRTCSVTRGAGCVSAPWPACTAWGPWAGRWPGVQGSTTSWPTQPSSSARPSRPWKTASTTSKECRSGTQMSCLIKQFFYRWIDVLNVVCVVSTNVHTLGCSEYDVHIPYTHAKIAAKKATAFPKHWVHVWYTKPLSLGKKSLYYCKTFEFR